MQRPPGPSAQLVCSGCRTVLLYPAGAQNVRCARCSTITSVAPPQQTGDMAQICCSNAQCRVVLMYPRGAGQVQCSVCGNLNDATQANQLGHIVCGGCQVTLAYAYGAQSVKCAVCSFVTPVGAAGPVSNTAAVQQQRHLSVPLALQQQQQQQQSQPSAAASSKPHNATVPATVVVENPGDVADIAVGRRDGAS